MKQILTIQHCESIHHTNGMVGSWTDWALTGYSQAIISTMKIMGNNPIIISILPKKFHGGSMNRTRKPIWQSIR